MGWQNSRIRPCCDEYDEVAKAFSIEDDNIIEAVKNEETQSRRLRMQFNLCRQYGYRENELIAAFDLPAHWLMMQMNNYCIGANYVFLDGKHYCTVHHA